MRAMSTTAPTSNANGLPRPYRAPGFPGRIGTEPLTGVPSSEPGDPLQLLDYRTQRHLIRAEDAPPGGYLAIESGTGTWLFPLTEDATHIGRGLSAQLRIDDCHVSRQHATVTYDGYRHRLLDGRSLNGTWVGGEQIASTVLCHGDLIEIGRLPLRYLQIE
jgi:pSer/pThr/pTyr-binding forkhead associated (FHA) protein